MFLIKLITKSWKWLGEDTNHNAAMVIVTGVALILAFPYFSRQINNVQIQIDSLQESIEGLYGNFVQETYCSELKDSFGTNDRGQKVVYISLEHKPIPNSVSVWEGIVNVPPIYFKVDGQVVEIETHWSPEILDQCGDAGIGAFTILYIPETKE